MHLIIYGPEGSGKGTQAKLLSQLYGLPIITSGDLVREAAVSDTGEIGKISREALSLGKYVPDKEMFALWERKLSSSKAEKGFILDGFPRNLSQTNFLLEKAAQNNYKIDKVIYLKLTDRQAFKRLVSRNRKLFEGSNISHDTPERIAQRLATYRQKEKEMMDFFREKNLLLEIDGDQSVDDVFKSIVAELKIVQ